MLKHEVNLEASIMKIFRGSIKYRFYQYQKVPIDSINKRIYSITND